MSCKHGLRILCLALVLSGCASSGGWVSGNTGDGMLVTGAMLHTMDSAGRVDTTQYPLVALSVKNLGNGRVYSLPLDSGHGLAALPAGTYCVNSVSPEDYATLTFCGQPYFTLTPGKIVFTGYFVFAVNLSTHTYKLVDSFIDPQGLANALTSEEKQQLQSFADSHNGNSD